VWNHYEFQAFRGMLSLYTAMLPYVVMMEKKNMFLSGLILWMCCLSDHKVAQYLSEFTINPVVGNSM
jgi:hypothetical protein